MLVAPGTGLNDAAKLGERVRRTIEAIQVEWEEQQFQVKVSIGIATWPMAGVSVCEELISAADQSLYNAKESGRNQVSKNWGGLVPAIEELVEVGQEHLTYFATRMRHKGFSSGINSTICLTSLS